MGSFLAFGCYKIFKVLEYQTANPGQDDDDLERGSKHHFFGHHAKEPISHSQTDTLEPKDHGVAPRNDSVIDGQMSNA
jgi:aquaporin related protein